MKLYEIDNRLREVIEKGFSFDEETGEFFDESSIEELEADRKAKWEAIAVIIKEESAKADALKKEMESLADRKKASDKRVDSLKAYLLRSMEQAGELKWDTDKCAVGTRKSESVKVDEEQLGKEWFAEKVTYSPDKTKIKTALKNGEIVPGAELESKLNLSVK